MPGPPIEWYIPILIFAARIVDVSLGTLRTIFVIGGERLLASALGFVEVCIWAVAVGGMVRYLPNPIAILAFAGGFATGSYVGMMIESKLALGYRVLRVINSRPELNVSAALREAGYKVTRLEGSGMNGPVEVIITAIRRKALEPTLAVIRRTAPEAFISVERADRASGLVSPMGDGWSVRLRRGRRLGK